MNYKKIAKFIKDARRLIIWNSGSLQYISNGVAAYPVFGMPKMKEMEMLNFLGLIDKADSIAITTKLAPDWLKGITYSNCGDDVLEKTGPFIILSGEVCRTFYTESGAIVCKNSYISAIESSVDEDMPVNHCLIRLDTSPAVAVFVGFDLYGIVMPMKTEDLHRKYRELSDMLCLSETHGAVKGEEYESEE